MCWVLVFSWLDQRIYLRQFKHVTTWSIRPRRQTLVVKTIQVDTPVASGEYCECDGTRVSDSSCVYGKMRWVLGLFWAASHTWVLPVLHNVVTSTVTASVASWLLFPAMSGAVPKALYRATHGSFG